MSSDGFWDSAQGHEYRQMWRKMTTASGVVATRPRAKGSARAAQERDLIEDAVREFAHTYHGGGWPRQRADVALDVWAVGIKDTPQPQNFAKRLLDQLGSVGGRTPIVYRDDRQVTMLYVRVDEIASATPTIHFAAQRASVIRDEIRRAPADEARQQQRSERDRELEDALEKAQEWVTDYRDDNSEVGKKFHSMGLRGERFYQQANLLHATDSMAESLVRAYAGVPPRYPEEFLALVADQLDLLTASPYAFNFGTLPSAGGSEAFTQSVHDAIGARIERYPMLYPPQMPVGVTAFYVPGADGKDLDNIFRDLVLPVLLTQCHLPRELRHPYRSVDEEQEERVGAGRPPRVAFIEGIALKGVPRPPGTVVVAMSDGWRHRSWWQAAIDRDQHLDFNPF